MPTSRRKTVSKQTEQPVEGEVKLIKVNAKAETKEKLREFIGLALPDMILEFNKLPIGKRWDYLIALMPYVTPKMQQTEVGGAKDATPISVQLSQLASSLTKE